MKQNNFYPLGYLSKDSLASLLETFPLTELPEHLDELLDSPWTRETRQQVDKWQKYVEQEFELGGAYE